MAPQYTEYDNFASIWQLTLNLPYWELVDIKLQSYLYLVECLKCNPNPKCVSANCYEDFLK